MDMDKLDFPEESFDFVYSSLALHYSDNLPALFKMIFSVLKTGGSLQFSITHPLLGSTECFTEGNTRYKVIGSKKDIITGECCALGDYYSKGTVQVKWSDEFIVELNHHTIAEWLNSMIAAGFGITKISEPTPIKSAEKVDKNKYLQYTKKPLFFIAVGKKD